MSKAEQTSEAWVEVNLVPAQERDERLLVDLVDPVVHEHLKDNLETWFFFWEPGESELLRLRIRWRDPAQSEPCTNRLFSFLNEFEAEETLVSWYEGSHGRRGETYQGEAATYGPEIWGLVQKDWMNGSELAVALVKLESQGRLTNSREFHWGRHVHLFTNQTFGTWWAEVQLCLRQAQGYLTMLQQRMRQDDPRITRMLDELERFLTTR